MKHVLTIFSLMILSSTVFAVAPRPRDICPAVVSEAIEYSGSGPGITVSMPVKSFSKSVVAELERKSYGITSEVPQRGDYSLITARSSVHSSQATSGEMQQTCYVSVSIEFVHDKNSERPVIQPRVFNLSLQSDFTRDNGCYSAIRAITKQLPECYK